LHREKDSVNINILKEENNMYYYEEDILIGKCGHPMSLEFSVDLNHSEVADVNCADCQYEDGELSFENYKMYRV
jgi:hypothetical protein